MNINYHRERVIHYHTLYKKHTASAAAAAIRAGKHLVDIRSEIFKSKSINWVDWMKNNLPFSQRSGYAYIRCYEESKKRPDAPLMSIRQLLGAKPNRVIHYNKWQRLLLSTAERISNSPYPRLEAMGLEYAVKGNEPPRELLEYTKNWIEDLELTSAIR